jgi:mRNA interferase MazF
MPARGDIVMVAGGAYTSKPRPVLIIQKSKAYTGDSLVVIPFTSVKKDSIVYRVPVMPTKSNGLDRNCYLEIDNVSAIKASSIGKQVGKLEGTTLNKVTNSLADLFDLPHSHG